MNFKYIKIFQKHMLLYKNYKVKHNELIEIQNYLKKNNIQVIMNFVKYDAKFYYVTFEEYLKR